MDPVKPRTLDPNASFKEIISATRGLDGYMNTAAMGDPQMDGPYQPAMTPTQTVNDGLYKKKSAKSEDPNWNTDAPPFGDQYPASPDLEKPRLPALPDVD